MEGVHDNNNNNNMYTPHAFQSIQVRKQEIAATYIQTLIFKDCAQITLGESRFNVRDLGENLISFKCLTPSWIGCMYILLTRSI